MRYRKGIFIALLIFTVFGCKEYWDNHYLQQPATVDENIWDALQRESSVSMFVDKMIEFGYDTLFEGDNTYTIFIPDNDAMTAFLVCS